MKISKEELRSFAKNFDTSYEDAAVRARGEFLRAYPLSSLKDMAIDDYVIGLGTPTFCARVEAKTRAWANMQGATASKFGIYFGKTKSDPKKTYRFTSKFGTTNGKAFKAVRAALLDLIANGKDKNFPAIDDNPLSQMFKAKILSLYYPKIYLNVCSADHLALISSELGLPDDRPSSEYQHLLLKEKLENPITKDWSNPMFMSFLYAKFIREDLATGITTTVRKPAKGSKKKVNFEDLQKAWDAIGKRSEEFALEWEKDRLSGLGHTDLIAQIRDRRETPSYGYDFLSFSTPTTERYIEVKSLGFDRKENCYRFFLSENEQAVSNSDTHEKEYYFYLVKYGSDGNPQKLIAKRAGELYADSDIQSCAYIVRLALEER